MKATTNYGLKKPELNDMYNVDDFNYNVDIIDTELKATSTKTDNALAHLSDTSNPHNVTKEQVGLGNVPNVSTNDQTPTYTVASSNANLSSGEKLSAAMGKISKAVSSLISHLSDTVGHITSAERTTWNGKLDATATAQNSEKLNNVPIGGFPRYYSYETTENGGTNGSGIDFNKLTQVGFHLMPGNFSGAANKPNGFYGDSSVIVTGNTACLTQIVVIENTICFRKNSWNGDFGEWNYGSNADTLDGYHAKDFVLLSDYNTKIVGGAEVVDFNTLFETKNYAFSAGSISIALNAPVVSNGFLKVLKGGGYTHQEYTANTGVRYFRTYNGSTWSNWFTDLHTGNTTKVIVSTTAPSDTTAVWIVP